LNNTLISNNNNNKSNNVAGKYHQKMTIVVSCRARGMPVEHNPKTAYFRISGDMKHGTELMCSFPSCRRAGVKFCYCAFCQTPVAKRNFRKRHMHDDLIMVGQQMQQVPVEEDIPSKDDATNMSLNHDRRNQTENNLNHSNTDLPSIVVGNGGMRNVTLPLNRFAPATSGSNETNLGRTETAPDNTNIKKEREIDRICGGKRESPKTNNGTSNSASTLVTHPPFNLSRKKRYITATSTSDNVIIDNMDSSNNEDIGSARKQSARSQSQDNSRKNSKDNGQKLDLVSQNVDINAIIDNAVIEHTSTYSKETLRQWIRMLFRRPNTDDQVRMSQWLLQVISIATDREISSNENNIANKIAKKDHIEEMESNNQRN